MISQEEDNSCFEGCPGFANKHGDISILESYRADRNIKDQLIKKRLRGKKNTWNMQLLEDNGGFEYAFILFVHTCF